MQGLPHIMKRIGLLTVALSFVAGLLVVALDSSPKATAASLSSRSMAISSSSIGSITTGAPGSGSNGQKAKYTFTFTPTTATISSLSIMFCTTPIPATGSCTTPTGFDASHVASIQSTTLAGSPSLDTTTANPSNTQGVCNGGTSTTRTNCILLKWATGTAQTGSSVTAVFGGGASDYITNPTSTGTFFARITTYSDNAYTTAVDSGTTASSTATQVTITAKVQEALNFSVGTASTAPGASCTPYSDGGTLSIGDPTNGLSSTTAYTGYSYFRVSTNAINGTKIYYSGDTLKSGSNSITSVGESAGGTSSTAGTSQFGLAIDTTDSANYSFTSLAPVSSPNNYGLGNGTLASAKFQYNVSSVTTPIAIATTNNVITCDTGSVQYVANIATNTPPGIYTTAVNYIAVPTY